MQQETIITNITDNDIISGTLTIPNGITMFAEESIRKIPDKKALIKLVFPDSATVITPDSLKGFERYKHLRSIEVGEHNKNYASLDGVLFNKSKTKLIKFPPDKEASSYIIPDPIKIIGEAAFANCKKLISITIPESVTKIEESAFHNCTALKDLRLPDSITDIGFHSFSHCVSLTKIKIPSSVRYIDGEVFMASDNVSFIEVDAANEYYTWYKSDCGLSINA